MCSVSIIHVRYVILTIDDCVHRTQTSISVAAIRFVSSTANNRKRWRRATIQRQTNTKNEAKEEFNNIRETCDGVLFFWVSAANERHETHDTNTVTFRPKTKWNKEKKKQILF